MRHSIRTALAALSALVFMGFAGPVEAQQTHLDPSRSLEERVDYLLSQLTLEEKLSLMGTEAPAIERLGIPEMWGWNQSLHGVVWNQPTTMFPVNIGMAATWNPELIQEVASVIHDEARAINNHLRSVPSTFEEGGGRQCCLVLEDGQRVRKIGLVFRSPVINISRQPLWGRIHEAYGEDPHLVTQMAVAYIRGMQGDHPTYLKTVSTAKHFAMNNQEINRHNLDAQVPERWIHEYYLPHFRAAFVEANAQSVMSIYNKLDGVPGAANSFLMTEMLRNAWGFEGFGVPDSNAIPRMVEYHGYFDTIEEAAAAALRSGHDLSDQQIGEGVSLPEALPGALAQGLVTEADIDTAVRRILKVRFRLGEFDPPEMVPYRQIPFDIVGSAEHRELSLETARQSLVLQQNDEDVLPFDPSAIQTLAVIGPHADREMTGIGYTGEFFDFITPIEGIRERLGSGTRIVHARGSGIFEADEAGLDEAAAAAAQADAAVVFVGTDRELEREGRDRTYLNLPEVQQQLIGRVLEANPNTAVVMVTAGPMSLTGPASDAPAVLNMFMAGEVGGTAVAEVLFGDYNPGGKLPYTVYESYTDVPGWQYFDLSKYPGYTYMYNVGNQQWPFGHGLSYTTFGYSNLATSSAAFGAGEEVTVTVDVRNTGDRAGDEVVQLYVRDLDPPLVRPIKQLRDFQRISLEPGEQQTVTLTVSAQDLSYFDVERDAFVSHPGLYEVMVGSSSVDIRGTARIQLTAEGTWPK